MKFAVDSNHRDFFEKNHLIEFEGLLNSGQLSELNRHLQEILENRIKRAKGKVPIPTAEQIFMNGRDLWREDALFRKVAMNKQLAEIASELLMRKPLRLGFDQLIPPPPAILAASMQDGYSLLMGKSVNLQQISSLQGTLCGLMLCLKSKTGELASENPHPAVFSDIAGNGIFFDLEAAINFSELSKRQDQTYLLIVYTHASSVYIMNEEDPQSHAMKNLGYNFGDKLNDKVNPIIYR